MLDDIGLYLEPDLEGYSGIDFSKARAMIDSGYTYTIKRLSNLEGPKPWVERKPEELEQKRQNFLNSCREPVFKGVRFRGFSKSQETYLRQFFKFDKHSELSFEQIKKAYYQIVSQEFFENVYPTVVYDDQLDAYVFELEGQQNKKLELTLGGNISTRSFSEIYLGLGYKSFTGPLMEHHLNFYSGRFYQSIGYSVRGYFPGSNFIYIRPEAIMNKWDYINSKDVLFDEDKSTILKQIDRKFGLNTGFAMGLNFKGEIEGSYINNKYSYSNLKNLNTKDTLDDTYFDGWKFGIRITSETFNRKMYPSRGQKFCLKGYYFTGREKYIPGTTSLSSLEEKANRSWMIVQLDMEKYLSFGRKYSFGWELNTVISNQPFFMNYYSTAILAPTYYPLYDSRTLFLQNFRAHIFFAGGIKNVFRISRNMDARLEGYAFVPYQQIENNDQLPEYGDVMKEVHFAGTGALVYHSPVGPISANLNFYDDPKQTWGIYFSLGYLIFNKSAMD